MEPANRDALPALDFGEIVRTRAAVARSARPATAAAGEDRRAAPLIEGYSAKLATRIGLFLQMTL
jgi:hypothetical protein